MVAGTDPAAPAAADDDSALTAAATARVTHTGRVAVETDFDISNPSVVWNLLVVSHEIGHNLSSSYTHDDCGNSGISEPVDLCDRAAPAAPRSACPASTA